MDKHLKVCSKRGQATQNGHKNGVDSELATERLELVEENVMLLRKALNEEISMRHEIIGELGSLKRRSQVSKSRSGEFVRNYRKYFPDNRRMDS